MNQIRLFFTDSDGQLAIAQAPNAPILAFVLFRLLALVVSGSLATWLQVGADVSLVIWAGLELFAGDSWFRRLLGLIVLLWLVMTRLL